MASAFGTEAQGLIYFRNTLNPATRISTNSIPGGPATGWTTGGLYYYALFYSTTATAVGENSGAVVGVNGTYAFDDPNWTFLALGTNRAIGRIWPTVPNTNSSTTVDGVPAGSAASFVVIGWSASMGSSLPALKNYYDGVDYDQNDWIGQSAVSGLITLSVCISTPIPQLFGLNSPQIPGFTLGEAPTFLPEPSTLALAAAGAAGLFFFRRRTPA